MRAALLPKSRICTIVMRAVPQGFGQFEQIGRIGIAKLFERDCAIVGDLVQSLRERREVGSFTGRSFARQQAGSDHQRSEYLPQLVDRALLCGI